MKWGLCFVSFFFFIYLVVTKDILAQDYSFVFENPAIPLSIVKISRIKGRLWRFVWFITFYFQIRDFNIMIQLKTRTTIVELRITPPLDEVNPLQPSLLHSTHLEISSTKSCAWGHFWIPEDSRTIICPPRISYEIIMIPWIGSAEMILYV